MRLVKSADLYMYESPLDCEPRAKNTRLFSDSVFFKKTLDVERPHPGRLVCLHPSENWDWQNTAICVHALHLLLDLLLLVRDIYTSNKQKRRNRLYIIFFI